MRQPDRSRRRWPIFVGPALSVALLAVAAALFAVRPIGAAVLTQFPLWMWSVPGSLLALLGLGRRRGRHRRAVLAALAGWFAILLALAEEPVSLARSLVPDSASSALRVVTLNAAGGSPEAANEVVAWKPEIVLLQETPRGDAIDQLAKRLYGADAVIARSEDTAVLARGTGEALKLPDELGWHASALKLRRPNGHEIVVVSLRLDPPPLRLDILSPDAWRTQSVHCLQQQAMLAALARWIDTLPPNTEILVGGDFNVPQRDAVTVPLQRRLTDAFALAGRGWGGTVMNELPLVRFDQIWVGGSLRPRAVRAVPTQNSDHRAVLLELEQ